VKTFIILLLLCSTLFFLEVFGNELKVKLHSKVLVDNRKSQNSSFDKLLTDLFQKQNIHVVETTQNQIEKSKYPLAIDIKVTIDLKCEKSKNNVNLYGMQCYFCELGSGFTDISTKEIFLSDSQSYSSCALYESQAIDALVQKEVKHTLSKNIKNFYSRWKDNSTWDFNLIIANIENLKAKEMNETFEKSNIIKNSSMVLFKKQTAVINIKGNGENNLKLLKKMLSENSSLKIHYEARKTIQAEYIFKMKPESISVEKFYVEDIFHSYLLQYREKGAGQLILKNTSSNSLSNFNVRYMINDKVVGTLSLSKINLNEELSLPVKIDVIPGNLNKYSQIKAEIKYSINNRQKQFTSYTPMIIHNKNSISWKRPLSIGAFINPESTSLRKLVSSALSYPKAKELLTDQLKIVAAIYSSFWHKPMVYVEDPVIVNKDHDIDTVQSSFETLKRMAGDCDDLTVLLASLLESAGIATAVIVTPNHVLLAAESGALAGGHIIFDLPESAFIQIDGALYIPIETTLIGSSFTDAWLKGIRHINKSKKLSAFRTRLAWKKYPYMQFIEKEVILHSKRPDKSILNNTFKNLRKKLSYTVTKQNIGTYSMATAVMDWKNGKPKKALKYLNSLCRNNNYEACYNLALMKLIDPGKSQGVINKELSLKLKQIPRNIISMLADNILHGVGKEINEEAIAQKKVIEIIRNEKKEIIGKKTYWIIQKTYNLDQKQLKEQHGKSTLQVFFMNKVQDKK